MFKGNKSWPHQIILDNVLTVLNIKGDALMKGYYQTPLFLKLGPGDSIPCKLQPPALNSLPTGTSFLM